MVVRIFIGDNEQIEELADEFRQKTRIIEEKLKTADQNEDSPTSTDARKKTGQPPVRERS